MGEFSGDPEHLERLKSGVAGWNAWVEEQKEGFLANLGGASLVGTDLDGANLVGAILVGANLSGASLFRADLVRANLFDANLASANLGGASLVDASFGSANLIRANLGNANLNGAILVDADLSDARLPGANLVGASLSGADLNGANLNRADLGGAELIRANLNGAELYRTKLHVTRFGGTSLGAVNLADAEGLSSVSHFRSSSAGTDTLRLTANSLASVSAPSRQAEVETFLRAAGVEELFIDLFQSLIGKPVEFYSAFISYTRNDESFTKRLYADLQQAGIRCWLDQHDMVLGQDLFETVNQAIRKHERIILCCSQESVLSDWVDREIGMTLDRERRTGERILIPLMLDDTLLHWETANGVEVRRRLAADFRGWDKDNTIYERELAKIVRAMRPGAGEV